MEYMLQYNTIKVENGIKSCVGPCSMISHTPWL